MEKVYAKFTKERSKAFRIETAIYQDQDGNREVVKTPLSPDSAAHVAKMYENSRYFAETGLLLPCTMRGESVVFPFVTGKSFYQLLLEAVSSHNKASFFQVLEDYKGLLQRLYPERKPFEKTEEYERVFGPSDAVQGMESVCKLNIDMTFDNLMLQNDAVQILDYEWIFDFPVPVKYAVYRAVYALCVKTGAQLTGFVEEEELYQFMDLSKEERTVFFRMNEAFMRYVEDGEQSYAKMLQAYRKPALSVIDKEESQIFFAQIYWNTAAGYCEEQSQSYTVSADQEDVTLSKNLTQIADLREIRIDPLNVSVLLEDLHITVGTEHGFREIRPEEMRTNRLGDTGETFLFETEDPQVILTVPEGESWRSIRVEFRILQKRVDQLGSYKAVLEQEFEKQLRKLSDQCSSLEGQLSEREQRLKENAEKLEQQERQIARYRDKLTCIEHSRIYKTLLKSKIDQLGFDEESV